MASGQSSPFDPSMMSSAESSALTASILGAAKAGISTGTPSPSPGAGTPATGANPADAQGALDAIPVAREGDVILASYFNALRDAVLKLGALVGVSARDRQAVVALSPAFFPISGTPPWTLGPGIASYSQSGGTVDGWLPVDLPNGSTIVSLKVTGKRSSGPIDLATVHLIRFEISDPDATSLTLVPLELQDLSGSFERSGDVKVPGAGPAGLLEFSTVDTRKFRYVVDAKTISNPNKPFGSLTIASIEVTCNRW